MDARAVLEGALALLRERDETNPKGTKTFGNTMIDVALVAERNGIAPASLATDWAYWQNFLLALKKRG